MKYASWAANQINRAYQVSILLFYDTLTKLSSSSLHLYQLLFKGLDMTCKLA